MIEPGRLMQNHSSLRRKPESGIPDRKKQSILDSGLRRNDGKRVRHGVLPQAASAVTSRFILPLCLFGAAAGQPVLAQDAIRFPVKPVRIVVPQAIGGGTDVQARLFGQKMAQNLGQPFIVDNRTGGGLAAVAASTAVASASPDGYTLLAVTPSFSYAPFIAKDYPVDPIRDFTPVSLVTRAPYALVVNTSVPAKSVKELIALAQAQPGKLNFGAGAIGSGTHLITEWFFAAANIKATYVPYKGTALAAVDLFAGRLDGALNNVLSAMPHIKAGRLRGLGISTAQRSKVLPDLPTIQEQGVPGYNASTFHGYVAPARTPAAILNKLSAEYARAVKSPEIATKLLEEGAEPVGTTPAEFREMLAQETQVWRTLIKEKGLKVSE